MSILITGGAGYIGSHTCVTLLENGYDLVVTDNFSNSRPEVLNNVKKITGQSFKFYETDMLDPNALDRIFTENKIETVIHFAAFKAVGESVAQPLRYYKNNLVGTLNLLNSMQQHQVKQIIYSSSATVYGSDNPVPYTEDMPIGRCVNPYGQTKVVIEFILQDLINANPDWNITTLRYFNPVDSHPSGLIGEEPQGIPNNLYPYIEQVAAGILPEVLIFGNDYDTPDGTGVRDYLHVCDLAEGHLAALNHMQNKTGLRIYNLGSGKGLSVLEMIQAFTKKSGKKIPYRVVDRRPGDLANAWADPSKANRELGWYANRSLELL